MDRRADGSYQALCSTALGPGARIAEQAYTDCGLQRVYLVGRIAELINLIQLDEM